MGNIQQVYKGEYEKIGNICYSRWFWKTCVVDKYDYEENDSLLRVAISKAFIVWFNF